MIIIGITGTLGAGKGTIVEYLVQQKGFQHLSVRAYLIQEIKKRGMPVNRDSMVIVGNDLRSIHGTSYIAQQLYEQAKSSGKNAIIESIRNIGEVTALKSMSLEKNEIFYLFAIDADPKTRYERIFLRGNETDNVSYNEFIMNEQREMKSIDPNKQNLSKCMQLADYTFINNGTIEELYKQIEQKFNNLHI